MLGVYRSISMETFVAAANFKNFMFFGFSCLFNNWIAMAGPMIMFITCGSITVGVVLTGLPVDIFGKTRGVL